MIPNKKIKRREDKINCENCESKDRNGNKNRTSRRRETGIEGREKGYITDEEGRGGEDED